MKTFFKKYGTIAIAIVIANLFLVNNSFGQAASGTWSLNSNATGVASGNVTVTSQTKGSGVGSASYNSSFGVTANSWQTSSQDANAYYQFTIAPTTGNNLTVTSINMSNSVNNTAGSPTALVQYSYDGVNFSAAVNVGTSYSLTTSDVAHNHTGLSILVTDGQTLYVRVFAWGVGTSGSLTFSTHSVVISGTTAVNCPTIIATAAKNDISCFNTSTGVITVTGSGGTSPYMFSIDNTTNYNATVVAGASYVPIDNTHGKFINLPVGSYKIRVKDGNGCESKQVQ